MTDPIIRFLALLALSLLVGTMFGLEIGCDPSGLSPSAYVEQQQHAIGALNTVMPAFGAVCALLTAASALGAGIGKRARVMLLGAVACLIVSGLVTRFANQPINREVMTWSLQAPPADWSQLRDRWRRWHAVRTVSGLAALSLAIAALIGRGRAAEAVSDAGLVASSGLPR